MIFVIFNLSCNLPFANCFTLVLKRVGPTPVHQEKAISWTQGKACVVVIELVVSSRPCEPFEPERVIGHSD